MSQRCFQTHCSFSLILLTALFCNRALFGQTLAAEIKPEPVLTQFATVDSLVAGVYDGFEPLADLKKYGDFGIGTFDRIDGEAVILDGTVYQVKGDGTVTIPDDNMTTPFASVIPFDASYRIQISSPLDFTAFCQKIEELEPGSNIILALRVRGKFSQVRTRSAYAQTRPYPPLDTAMANQPEFELGTVEGCLLGFRLPPFMKGLNVPGFHLHFLTSDKTQGGHLLRFQLEEGELEIMRVDRFRLILPPFDSDFYKTDLNIDRTREIRQVEASDKNS